MSVDAREARERADTLGQIEVCYSTEAQAGARRILQRAVDLGLGAVEIESAKTRGLADRARQIRSPHV